MAVQTEEFATARDFLEALRPSGKRWIDTRTWNCPWVFRGQGDANWELTPSAWRDDTAEHHIWKFAEAGLTEPGIDLVVEELKTAGFASSRELVKRLILSVRFEYGSMMLFTQMADKIGFRIPGGSLPVQFPRLTALQLLEFQLHEGPAIHPALALAQHHGMPTRLLDWSTNPLAAAFFAAADVDPESPGQIAVWAYDTSRPPTKPQRVEIFTVPRSEVGFLHAQDGLFTYIRRGNWMLLANGSWPQHKDFVEEGSLRKLTLPNAVTPELLRLLWIENVSKAHLMPTLDNVAASLKDAHQTAGLIDRLTSNQEASETDA